jgi:hypothetical protein
LGYTVPIRTREFEFKDGDLKGLVVAFRANPALDDYFDLVELAEAAAKSKGLEPVRHLLREVARIGLVGWNLENGAGPLPATPENFTAHLPPLDGVRLVNRYLSEVGGVADPKASAAGATSGRRRKSKPRPS